MTRRTVALAVVALVVSAGCRHPRRAPPDEGKEDALPQRQGVGGIEPKPGRPRVPAAPEGLLSPDAIRELQRALVHRRLLGEHREGDVDPPTSAALQKFQAEHGLAATGFPDRETLVRLGVDPEKAYRRARE